MTRAPGEKTNAHQSGICVPQCMEACQIYPFSSLWVVWRWRISRTIQRFMFGTLVKNGGKAIHLFVWELREYLTKQHSGGEWFLLPALEPEQQSRSAFSLQPSQHRGGSCSTQQRMETPTVACTAKLSLKSILYNFCQNRRTIYRAAVKREKKRKRTICLHDKLIPRAGARMRCKGTQTFHPFNGISTQILTCALSLLRGQKIYGRNIEFVHRQPFLLAILYVPHESREGSGALCLQHLRVCEVCLCSCGLEKKSPHVQHTVVHMSIKVFYSVSPRTL